MALVAEVAAAGALASLPATTLPSVRKALGEALGDGLGEESRALQLRLQRHADVTCADPHDALFARHALGLLIENRRAGDAIEDLKAGRDPARHIQAPIYRSRRAAVRNGLRAFLVVLISGFLFSLGGWPFASEGLNWVGVFIALSATNPNPRAFAANAVIAMPIAALLAGVTEFLILDGVDQFPLLAIGMAPSVLAAALLFTMPNPRLAGISFLVLVFFPVMLSPTNPQSYNPETYLFSSLMMITAAVLVFVLVRTLFPTSDALRRHWFLASARAEMRDLLAGGRSGRLDDEALFRDADRIGQLAALKPAEGDRGRDDLRQALDIFGCAAAVRRVRTALAELSARTGGRLVEGGYRAWPPATRLPCAAPPPIWRARRLSSIMTVRPPLARPAWIFCGPPFFSTPAPLASRHDDGRSDDARLSRTDDRRGACRSFCDLRGRRRRGLHRAPPVPPPGWLRPRFR